MSQGKTSHGRVSREQEKWRLIAQAGQERAAMVHLLEQWRHSSLWEGPWPGMVGLMRSVMGRSGRSTNTAWWLLSLLPLIQRLWPTLDPWSWRSWLSHAQEQIQQWSATWAAQRDQGQAAQSKPFQKADTPQSEPSHGHTIDPSTSA
jgi:hypothetical protein